MFFFFRFRVCALEQKWDVMSRVLDIRKEYFGAEYFMYHLSLDLLKKKNKQTKTI